MAAPLATKQRAAYKTVAQAEKTLNRVPEHLDTTDGEPVKRGPGCPPKATASLEQVAPDVEAARHEHPRLAGQRETVTQSIRAIGHAYHFVDLERGVRRNGTLIAGEIQQHIDVTVRPSPSPGNRPKDGRVDYSALAQFRFMLMQRF